MVPSEIRTAHKNLNSELVGSIGASPVPSGAPPDGTPDGSGSFPDYVCRVTADEAEIGRGRRNLGDPALATREEIDEYGRMIRTGLE